MDILYIFITLLQCITFPLPFPLPCILYWIYTLIKQLYFWVYLMKVIKKTASCGMHLNRYHRLYNVLHIPPPPSHPTPVFYIGIICMETCGFFFLFSTDLNTFICFNYISRLHFEFTKIVVFFQQHETITDKDRCLQTNKNNKYQMIMWLCNTKYVLKNLTISIHL